MKSGVSDPESHQADRLTYLTPALSYDLSCQVAPSIPTFLFFAQLRDDQRFSYSCAPSKERSPNYLFVVRTDARALQNSNGVGT